MEEGGKLPPGEMFYVAPFDEMAETRNTQALGMTRVACAIGVPLPPTPCLGAKRVWVEDVEAPMLSAANAGTGAEQRCVERRCIERRCVEGRALL